MPTSKRMTITASQVQAGDVLHQGPHRHIVDETKEGPMGRTLFILNNDTGSITFHPDELVVVSRTDKKLQHFATTQEVLDYMFEEITATLEDDASNNEDDDPETAAELRAKIADIEFIRRFTTVVQEI